MNARAPTPFARRVNQALAAADIDQTEAARRLSARLGRTIKPQTVQYMASKANSSELTADLAAVTGTSYDYIAHGTGELVPPGNITALDAADRLPADVVLIKESRLKFSGGHGHLSYEIVEDSEPAHYRLSWFQKERINPAKVKRFRVTGNSMEPMLFPGDTILVNLAETEVRDGRIYALRYRDELRVKILHPKLDGSLVLRSVNREEYPDETVPKKLVTEHITIIGRVRDKSGRGGL